jgi:hypothetical protein
MRRILVAILLTTCGVARGQTEPPRHLQNIDFDWRFFQGDLAGAQAPDFDDSNWRKVDLPHDWSIEGEYRQSRRLRRAPEEGPRLTSGDDPKWLIAGGAAGERSVSRGVSQPVHKLSNFDRRFQKFEGQRHQGCQNLTRR